MWGVPGGRRGLAGFSPPGLSKIDLVLGLNESLDGPVAAGVRVQLIAALDVEKLSSFASNGSDEASIN